MYSLDEYIVAGLIASPLSDTVMHPLDTIKTRQQAAPNALQYKRTIEAFKTIFVQEGFFRGWYSGYSAAMLGSIPRGITFFGTYEYLKKRLIVDYDCNKTLTHLFSGLMGDLVTSVVFVPSEVLKTRLQLQGKYNNLYFRSGYNYKSLTDCVLTIIKQEGFGNLYRGYKATLYRDLPFSAMQFAFYEEFRFWAVKWENSDYLSISSELLAGGAAGGITGILTTPLDVYKTRLQTSRGNQVGSLMSELYKIYKHEGLKVVFSGVQPRFVWTSVQSSIMLLVYQEVLKMVHSDTKKRSRTSVQ